MKLLFSLLLLASATTHCRTAPVNAELQEVQDPALRPIQENALRQQVRDASSALTSVLFSNDALDHRRRDMKELLTETKCLLSLHIVRGAFGLGGGGGTGLMTCRHPSGGWSAPSFVRTGQLEVAAAIGIQTMNVGIFITDNGLAESFKSQLNFNTRAYAEAIAANASAAIRLARRHGMAVFQKSEIGLFAGVGITVQSMSHMQAQRNQLAYRSLGTEGTPQLADGTPCSRLRRARARRACVTNWERNNGGSGHPTSVEDIFALSADEAPELTRPFNQLIRELKD